MKQYRVYITSEKSVHFPVIIVAASPGMAEIIAKQQYPHARAIGVAVEVK